MVRDPESQTTLYHRAEEDDFALASAEARRRRPESSTLLHLTTRLISQSSSCHSAQEKLKTFAAACPRLGHLRALSYLEESALQRYPEV
ncbi:hypothetical protein CGCF413_v014947 [Colletotrichum fructicola]|nr:hypothetical protein CGCF413_v014947 [Colletotrichum fructicola]